MCVPRAKSRVGAKFGVSMLKTKFCSWTLKILFFWFSAISALLNNSNLGTYGSGNLLPCGAVVQRHVARGRLRSWVSPCQQQIAQRLSPWPRLGQVPDASTMGRYVGLLTGAGDTEILWCSSNMGVLPRTGSRCFLVMLRRTRVLCRGEYDRCGGQC